jgi:hypothetical protein
MANGVKLSPTRTYEHDAFGRLVTEGFEINGVAGLQGGSDLDVVSHYREFQSKIVNRLDNGQPVHSGSRWYLYETDLIYPYGPDIEAGTDRSTESRFEFERYTQVSGLGASLAAHTYGYLRRGFQSELDADYRSL